ncbi:sigma-54-dependent Fis family transcriptional regulator [Halomonas sp. HP20-15]|uniref:sigma-54-dependent Fis family transcriptional regulator n=1 Tax=Halomonas sp. HP20-15 TaxID=3085901 RepID=UPI0029814137|nr:sigma-54-dependent Fis family transcriptional regulator [Halomonas sp. HP20-15]MDW5378158.1 sigma-54-dependent Fis family transcriptional regulator [Halomonas sp. HP20-15]
MQEDAKHRQRAHIARARDRLGNSEARVSARQPARHSAADIARRRTLARPLLELLEKDLVPEVAVMLRHWQCVLVLADRDAVILAHWGDSRAMLPSHEDWLLPGTQWQEAQLGCNAIGSCLAEDEALDVIGREHTCDALHHLAGHAVPVRDWRGENDACLALLSDPYRNRSSRYSGLLQVLAMQIENGRLIAHYRHRHFRLAFNANRDDIDGPRSGLLILDAHGRPVNGNSRACWLLKLEREALTGTTIDTLFDTSWSELVARGNELVPLRVAGRYHCYGRLAAPDRLPDAKVPAKPSPLSALDLGDPRLRQAITLAERLGDRGIAMLLYGETGTGKEVFVKALHATSRRADKPLVAINCAAIPDALVEAELFGYVRGAFTGADPRGNPGRLREAHGGRLFLDEIGDMPLPVQARLLRALQERKVTPLGGSTAYPVDIEVIAATHRPLADEVASGRFRADLYYRLCGVELSLPPLRERHDIPALVQVLLAQLTRELDPEGKGGTPPRPSPALLDWLCRQRWPGNIREMENVLRVALAISDGPLLDLQHLPANAFAPDARLAAPAPQDPHEPPISRPISARPTPAAAPAGLRERLAAHRGNLSALARELGISRTTLYKRLREQAEVGVNALG